MRFAQIARGCARIRACDMEAQKTLYTEAMEEMRVYTQANPQEPPLLWDFFHVVAFVRSAYERAKVCGPPTGFAQRMGLFLWLGLHGAVRMHVRISDVELVSCEMVLRIFHIAMQTQYAQVPVNTPEYYMQMAFMIAKYIARKETHDTEYLVLQYYAAVAAVFRGMFAGTLPMWVAQIYFPEVKCLLSK